MDSPDPAYVQRNIQTLSAIGGVYDFVALMVEQDHIELLRQYRLDTGAKCALELIAERGHRPLTKETEELKCQSSKPDPK